MQKLIIPFGGCLWEDKNPRQKWDENLDLWNSHPWDVVRLNDRIHRCHSSNDRDCNLI